MSDNLIGLHHFEAYCHECEKVVWDQTYRNLITTAGKGAYLDRLAGLGAVAAFTTLGVGNSATAAAVTDTQLQGGSVFLQAADATFPSRSGTVLSIQTTFGTAVANFTWNEAGYFNGVTNGTSVLFNRVIIGPFAKTAATSISYTSTISQA